MLSYREHTRVPLARTPVQRDGASFVARTQPGAAWLLVGGTLLSLPCATLVVASLSFSFGRALHAALSGLVMCVAAAWARWLARSLGFESRWHALGALSAAVLVLGVGASLASVVYDLGFDSQSYHQLGILELAGGWNPFRGPASLSGPYALYAGHYSIGTWLQAALVFLVTGDLESAKAINLLMIAASFCLAYGALLYTGIAGKRMSALVAAAAAFNPVALAQCLTFYVDGYLGSALVILASTLLLVVSSPRAMPLVLAAGAVMVTVNTKFTGGVYAVPFVVCAGLALWLRTRSWSDVRRLLIAQSAAWVIAVCLLGFHPYVTNTVRHGHPYYPLVGEEHVHEISFLRPRAILYAGRVERLLISLFSDPSRDFTRDPQLVKWPFSVSAAELERFGTPDPRVGGWGPLFSGSLLLSTLCMAFKGSRTRYATAFSSLALLAIIGSTLLNSECWWARFSPQMCLIPLVAALHTCSDGGVSRGRCAYGGLLVCASLLGSALVIRAQILSVPARSAEVASVVRELASPGRIVYLSSRWIGPLFRLRERGIAVIEVPDIGEDPDPELGRRVPCQPLRAFPGTMQEIHYCAVRKD